MINNPNITNLSDASNGQLEYVGGLKFEAQDFDLKSIPTNKEAAKAAVRIMPWVRVASLMLLKSDDELTVMIEDDQELHLEMLEGIVEAQKYQELAVNVLRAGSHRLTIVLERALGEDVINRSYGSGAKS